MIVRKNINFNEPLTDKQKKMLEALETRTPEPDEDCPELTDEMNSYLSAEEFRKPTVKSAVSRR